MRRPMRVLMTICVLCVGSWSRGAEGPSWPAVTLPAARDVQLAGPLGEALQRGVDRLVQPPYAEPWLRADVSFEVKRIFTNYSGDVSGRFLELASLTSPAGRPSPATLAPLLKSIARFQKPDGHFGADVDLKKPLVKNSPPIPMLWGNARLLVGLVAAAEEFHDPEILAAARRLGDYYVNTADQLCSPDREADYHSSGTYGDGYCCCYFPAIEGLTLLYRATKDDRYLKQAERMAEFFQKFDCLPTEHSHGNLCAWRGILMLYATTHDRRWLDRARAKWDAATKGGYVWPIGGVGEHFAVSFHGDEGCSESDWLRFNLDLWRFTGLARYVDVAERLLENQYITNQCANGGFGMCRLDADPAGPYATTGQLDEWPFCCSFHGPLGLHYLKSYLAAGTEQGVLVNFLYDFTAKIEANGRTWTVTVRRKQDKALGGTSVEIQLAAQGGDANAETTLCVRKSPGMTVVSGSGQAGPALDGYVCIPHLKAGAKIEISREPGLTIEARRFATVRPKTAEISRLRDVAVLQGPEVLFSTRKGTAGRPVLLATVDKDGRPGFPASTEGRYATVALPGLDAPDAAIAEALKSGRSVLLGPWAQMTSHRPAEVKAYTILDLSDMSRSPVNPLHRLAFMFDLVVVPAESLEEATADFAVRVKAGGQGQDKPLFGENLEKRREVWLAPPGWKFTPGGLLITGGDVGLLDAEGYDDYRLEFDLTLPEQGQGLSGWVVRAKDGSCLMFQLQSADSTFQSTQFKTRPNTLRPHVGRGGQWEIADPVPLPKEIRRGESHHVAVECRQDAVEVFLDGQSIYRRSGLELRGGTIGLRASNPGEQGLFRAVRLSKL